jgi:hypothetical protein
LNRKSIEQRYEENHYFMRKRYQKKKKKKSEEVLQFKKAVEEYREGHVEQTKP